MTRALLLCGLFYMLPCIKNRYYIIKQDIIMTDTPTKEEIEEIIKLAEKGYAEAQCNLGFFYQNGIGVEKDPKKAFEWMEKSAKQEFKEAECELGRYYKNGIGVEKDPKKAFKWMKKSAEQELDLAQCELGNYYENGIGVVKDLDEAFKWIEKSAIQGLDLAQFNLGIYYQTGTGEAKDPKKAFEWMKQSAEQEFKEAECNLGDYYRTAFGIEENPYEAFKWMKKSAERGLDLAEYNLGIYYDTGIGTEVDKKKAFVWIKKSAMQGNAQALFNLGVFYETGTGVGKNLDEAIKYYRCSLNGGLHNVTEKIVNIPDLGKVVVHIHEILKLLLVNDTAKLSLTHFTTLSTFEKVINKERVEKLRLQNIDGCNDPMEGKTLFEWFNIESVNAPDMEDSYPLILSLCKGSPENLPMWNTYADNSTGVGLSLSDVSIKELTECKDPYADNLLSISPKEYKKPALYNVLYLPRECEGKNNVLKLLDSFEPKDVNKGGRKKLEDLKKEIIKNDEQNQLNAIEKLKTLKNKLKEIIDKDKDKDVKLKEYLPKLLIELAHVVKYDDYQYEKEIRLVRFAFKSDIDDESLKCCGDSKRVYMDAPLIKFGKVTTAPRVTEETFRDVKYLADCHDIEIKKSKIRFQ